MSDSIDHSELLLFDHHKGGEWNETTTDYPKDAAIHELFAQRLAQFGSFTAVVDAQNKSYSYDALHERAAQFAHKLVDRGIAREQLVGVLLDRSFDWIASLLAVLMAGGAYVPIDPELPEARIRTILLESGAKLLLTSSGNTGQLADYTGEIMLTDDISFDINGSFDQILETGDGITRTMSAYEDRTQVIDRSDAEGANKGSALAYVMYTSGSTGRPKGVMIEHRSIIRLVVNTNYVTFRPGIDRLLQTGSPGFDASTFEIWGALLNGACLVLANKHHLLDTANLASVLSRHRITMMWLTAPLFHQLVLDDPSLFQALDDLIVGGDIVQPLKALAVLHACPNLRLVNGYGPTENTTFSTYYPVDRSQLPEASIPIGWPISNATAYIVDDSGQELPIGAVGELWVGGDGVARGYLGEQELTAQKFISSPFRAGERLYKTGDLARRDRNGAIEFLGRADHQVKIRGFRIELAEVEHHLLRLSGVREAVVLTQGRETDQELSAYYVAEPGVTTAALADQLRAELPDYMVPAQFIRLERMPLTSNGKIDRSALLLAAPDTEPSTTPYQHKESGEKLTQLEDALLTLWRQVLRKEEIDSKSNFFLCGGHSILAMALVAQIRRTFGVPFSIKTLFDYPSVNEAAIVLALQLAQTEGPAEQQLAPATVKDRYLLSSAQMRMFVEQQLVPESTAYNIPMCWRIDGPVDVARLQQSLQKLIERHDSLRTSFTVIEGIPTQRVQESAQAILNLMPVDPQDWDGSSEQYRRDFVRPFDLTQAPLLHAAVLVHEAECLLLLDVHHIVSDGKSMSVLLDEWSRLYAGEQLVPVAGSYVDYAEWEQQYLDSTPGEKEAAYWHQIYAEPIVPLRLPYDKNVSPSQPRGMGRYEFHLSTDISSQLKMWSDSQRSTLFATLFGLYQLLWHRRTGQSDMVIGTAAASRHHAEIQQQVGMFVSTLAIRGQFEDGMTLTEWIGRTNRTLLEAYEHQLYPYERLVRHIRQEEETAPEQLFDTVFVWQNAGPMTLALSGQSVTRLPAPDQDPKFDLLLEGEEKDGQLIFRFDYAADRFSQETITLLADDLKALAAWTAESYSDTAVDSCRLPSLVRRQQRVQGFNDTAVDYPNTASIPSLFAEQVQLFTQQTAVVHGSLSLTYGELESRARLLAGVLHEQGVRSGMIVGIMLPRSLDYIVSVLAVLMAGGAYMPLDPELPDERIRYMLEDAGAARMLTTSMYAARVSTLPIGIVRTEESCEQETASDSMRAAMVETDANALAYVMYTSGSTGMPKGVMIEHRGVVRLVRGANYIDFHPGQDKILQAGAIGFDASTFEIWGALLNGGTLVLADKYDLLAADSMQQLIATHGITIMLLTSPLFHQLAAERAELFAPLRALLVGGDVVLPQVAKAVRERCQRTRLINVYGPTENATFSTCFTIDEDYEDSIPIGYPVSNSTAYIVGNAGQLLDVGEVGELWVGGDGVAQGYRNKPALTADKFIVSPFRDQERVYKTGDMARWRSDGAIEFLGRQDRQVKIRGYRIEIAEIEHWMMRHEAIREAVVRVKQLGMSMELLLYYTADRNVHSSEMTIHAGAGLPVHMVPHACMQLDRMPLSMNGKIDINALPDIEVNDSRADDLKAACTEMELRLLELWQETLGTEPIGIDDNFFKLGGHSLIAMRLIAAMNQALGMKLPVRILFEQPTVRRLVATVEDIAGEALPLMEAGDSTPVVAIDTRPALHAPNFNNATYPIAYSQRNLFLAHHQHQESPAYNMPMVWSWIASSNEPRPDRQRLESSLQEMIARHEAFRTSFHIEEEQPVQRIHSAAELTLQEETIDREADLEAAVRTFIRPFDLAQAPLLRAKLIRMSSGAPDKLLLDMHHIIADGVSVDLFMNQLMVIYDGGQALDRPIVQLREAALWQHEQVKSDSFKQQEAYWLSQYEIEVPVIELPLDFPRPSLRNGDGGRVTVSLDRHAADKLNRLAEDHSSTLFMLLFAVYNVWLSKYTSQSDLVVGTPAAGRRNPAFQDTIGMLVNTLAIRSYPLGEKPFNVFLEETRANIANALENQDYPFELLVSHAAASREPGRNPLFATMFVLASDATTGEKAQRFRRDRAGIHRAKFDLLVEAETTSDELAFHFEYDAGLFERRTVAAMSAHFMNLLHAATVDPSARLAQMEWISADETSALHAFNPPEQPYACGRTVLELLENSFSAHARRTAVVYGKDSLTYDELHKYANRVARALMRQDIGRGCIVAMVMDRSIEAIITAIGIMKSGTVYLPIDRILPKQRMERIVKEAGAAAVIIADDLLDGCVFEQGTLAITYEALLQEQNDSDVLVRREVGDLAYLIFTSGSTGHPKGVMIGERSFVNAVEWHRQFYRIGAEDRSTQYASLGFDASILEIFPYLIAGAALHVIPELLKLDIPELNAYYEAAGITVTFLPTQISESFMTQENRSLRLLLTAGDKLNSFVPQRYEVYNNYGPTENTVVASCHLVQDDESNIPIGRPVAGSRIYILSADHQLMPIGLAGELCIAGAGLSLGYWQLPEQTQRAFVQNPFSPGERMYRTGDRAKWRPDGTLEFLGRIDEQVKIRGNRVEPAEVQRVISEHPEVSSAIVFDHTDIGQNKVLCAGYAADREISQKEWMQYCEERLPEYMRPSLFLKFTAIPLTANGKIDRKQLRELASAVWSSKADRQAADQPRDWMESLIVDSFQAVLGARIGIHDRFFENGGDSIKAIRVVAQLSDRFEIRINDLFEYQSAAELRTHIRVKSKSKSVNPESKDVFPAAVSLSTLKKELRHYKARVLADLKNQRGEGVSFNEILLTGATGYFGIHLLHDLLRRTNSRIRLLVRAMNDKEAVAKAAECWSFYFDTPFSAYSNRVVVIAGDLELHRLGLEDAVYEKLAEEVDCIIHSAAKTQHYGFREQFERVNVTGTEHMLQLAAAGRSKAFYYMSTMSVAAAVDPNTRDLLFTDYTFPDDGISGNYYMDTKKQAELRVLEHRKKGHAAVVVRLGNLVFHSGTGRFQRNIGDNAFYGLMRAWMQLGRMPDSPAKMLDFSFIDYASASVAAIVSRGINDPVLHVTHPRSISYRQAAQYINQSVGDGQIRLEPVDKLLREAEAVNRNHMDTGQTNEISQAWEKVLLELSPDYASKRQELVHQSKKSHAILVELGVEWPAVSQVHIALMITYCRIVGWM
ncbi:amino acid adenylation domain-containing protein/thioester reductase-like protein [Paenibacillus phyllosphaerae]|uniref:Amino acid adenylation domain-containing protein/thioester reductase-like protein n=1 Tax=Paenibacillus phyllosphaerae TaxID=274593 RepID=A0A7W5B374_9BACL|nr:non-ribosomal peptide synthetase [Paenibacillus phyllosphaerae]MBB3113402.1 amino acid adenylation domain-containing protein/thioester reductase-like protein [Paenibacillus phyllosphaerae]